MALLEVELAGRDVRRIDLDTDKLTVGRGTDVHLVLRHPTVSRAHCEIVRHGDRHFVHDLDSKSGVYRGEDSVGFLRLEDGDELDVGPFLLRYRAHEGGGDKASASAAWEALDGLQLQSEAASALDDEPPPRSGRTGDHPESAAGLRDAPRQESDEDFLGTVQAGRGDALKLREALRQALLPRLRVRIGRGPIATVPLEQLPCRVGHDPDAEVPVPGDRRLGRWRFAIDQDEGDWIVAPMSRWSSVTLNGERVRGPQTLLSGDRLESGPVVVKLLLGDSDS